jgi:imidazolonepropionase
MASSAGGAQLLENASIACKGERIVFVGTNDALDQRCDAIESIDLQGRLVTPGFIDCHTHLVHAGDRSHEFEQRLSGVSYETIARAGGGILSTVRATREASDETLVQSALQRLDVLLGEGVTTIEIKSGYGLNVGSELRMLAAARRLASERAVEVRTTYLGAHALPPEAGGNVEAYIDEVCEEGIPAVVAAGLADAFDAFCERIAFSPAQVTRVFAAARAAGLKLKLHADQLSNLHGARLAAEQGALSADHLEYTDSAGVAAMQRAGTVAVLLPGAFYTLRETQLPPIDMMRRHRVPMAVATDYNPGTSPLTSILLAMNMASTLFRMTIDEVLVGVTRNAARALGRLDEIGTLEVGKRCDLAIWNVDRPAQLVYHLGLNPLQQRVFAGLPAARVQTI